MRLPLAALIVLAACKPDPASDGEGGTRLTRGVKEAFAPEKVTDAGPRVIVFNTQQSTVLWAVGRAQLQEVLYAVKTNRGEDLAKVLERYPAVDARLIAHARAVMGRGPISEPAELALVGPFSLPFGGLHQPLTLADALPPGVAATAGAECQDTLGKPGSVGQLLAGVGKSRAIFLLDDAELARFTACVDKVQLPADAPEVTAKELARLKELLRMGKAREAAVLLGMGS